MAIKNIMEDIVNNIVEEIFRVDESIDEKKVSRDDVLAYVLNRTTPKYVTSERGILHGKLDEKYITQQKTDILFLIYEAIEIITSRRSSVLRSKKDDAKPLKCLPHIIGEVLEETTFSVVPDVEVTLYYKGEPLPMITPEWANPYMTNRATKGYFHFWPEYLEEKCKGKSAVTLEVRFRHPKFKEKTVEIEVDCHSKDNFEKSHLMQIVLLQVVDGIDLNFLYE
jgi:hypothetical protein